MLELLEEVILAKDTHKLQIHMSVPCLFAVKPQTHSPSLTFFLKVLLKSQEGSVNLDIM